MADAATKPTEETKPDAGDDTVIVETPNPETPPTPEAKPTTPATPEQSAKPLTKEDVQNATAAAMKAERERAGKILAACEMAKRPELAQKFINEENTVEEVNAALLQQICSDWKPLEDEPQNSTVGPTNKTDDPEAAYKAEYAQAKADYERMGLSESDYIQSRKIDDGKMALTVGSAKK